MPYRIDIRDASAGAFDRLIDLGALDVEQAGTGFSAILPDAVSAAEVAQMLGLDAVRVTPARGRDAESVWILRLRHVRVGRWEFVPADSPPQDGALRLVDGPLVLANVLTAPLIELAPAVARLVGHGGRLVLSGFRAPLAPEVDQAYRHVGLRSLRTRTRDDWTALVFGTSW